MELVDQHLKNRKQNWRKHYWIFGGKPSMADLSQRAMTGSKNRTLAYTDRDINICKEHLSWYQDCISWNKYTVFFLYLSMRKAQSYSQFLSWYSMAALRLKASISAVSCRVKVLPTLRTSMPSVVMPTLSSGCSRIPRSMMSALVGKIRKICPWLFV